MNILVVDDQADICEIISFVINHELKANIVTAVSGNKAIDILKKQNFDMVICDYSMPDGNGLVVHDYIKHSSPETKFIFCSDESDDILNQADNVFFHIIKPNVFDYIKELKQKLENLKEIEYLVGNLYTEISLKLAKTLSPLPFDLYLKLSGDNFVKFFATEYSLTEEDIQAIQNKSTDVLYVKTQEMLQAKEQLLNLIHQTIENSEGQSVFDVQEYVIKYFQEFGYDQRVQEMAIKSLQRTIQMIMKEKEINQYLLELLKSGTYPRKLYAVTVCFSSILLKSANLLNESMLEKMIASIYLQDLFVTKSACLPLYTKAEAEEFKWTHQREKESYFLHPIRASEFVRKTNSIPPDVDRMIMESHELPSGKGFPRGLTSSQISPLSCVLILSNLLSREFLRFETAFSTVEYLEFLNRKHGLDQGQFKKIFDAALAIDFFPKK